MAKQKKKSLSPARQQTPLWVWVSGGLAVLGLLTAGLLYLGLARPGRAGDDIAGLVLLPEQERGHVDGDIDHPDDVPAGGVHNDAWQNCGIYTEPVRDENVIHSMEHGAVWLAYQPNLPANQVEILQALVRQERSRLREPMIVLAPKPGLDAPIIVTAWRVQLALEDAGDERLVQFVRRYQRGPYTPELGASCFDSLGEPLS
jgi:hypothetical protein